MKNLNHKKWKKIYSCILAVCLIGSLVLANQSFGVFAEKTEEQSTESTTEENTQITESTEEKKETTEAEKTTGESKEQKEDTAKTTTEAKEKATIKAQQAAWEYTSGDVKVAGNGTDPKEIKSATGSNENKYTGSKSVVFDYNISSTQEIDNKEVTIEVSDCGIMSDDESIEIWKISGDSCTKITSKPEVSEGKVSFTADSLGEYIAVSDVTTVDLAKSDVTYNADYIKGTRQDGNEIKVDFLEDSSKKYRVSQSNNSTRVSNSISSANDKKLFTIHRTIILDGINTRGKVNVHGKDYKILLKLILRNENQIDRIYYGAGKNSSNLTIDAYNGNDNEGKLYIPYKMKNKQEEIDYVNKQETNRAAMWAAAGIGGGGSDANGPEGTWRTSDCIGLTIAGGTIRVFTKNQYAASAIGGGGNGEAKIEITGGNITAVCSGTGAAIGGGIGWLFKGGDADVSITGGTIYAENMKYRTADSKQSKNVSFGGVAIGSGSSTDDVGNKANIKISGSSNVTAYARYGNGIGSGNSYNNSSAKATINIGGNSIIKTNALGGGTSKANQGGSADITVSDNAKVDCVKYSDISDKYDTETENFLGAFGIGGGNSAGTYKGGSANVNVTGGTMNCNGGNIGGGNATGSGNGGDAAIKVTGGTLDCASIGGGNSQEGTPGAVTSDTQEAGVVVSGGTLKAGTIGGGRNKNNEIGFATANISGGNIQGQFILANTDTSKQCTFKMSGGTIDNTNLGTGSYKKVQQNGGAVYLSDPKGLVDISGGTIQNSKASLGGAVYMTAGEFKLSETGTIQDCTAEIDTDGNNGYGGAVYLGKGTVTIAGGFIGTAEHKNTAVKGAGVYQKAGMMEMTAGTISSNEASENGGGVYLEDGQLEVKGGTFSSNKAVNGAGTYVSGGILNISGGNLKSNNATNGAGSYVSGGTLNVSGGTLEFNDATNGAGSYVSNGTLNISGGTIKSNTADNGAGTYVLGGNLNIKGGNLTLNTAKNGGGSYLAGGQLEVSAGTITNNTADNGAGVYVSDSKVRMFGGEINSNKATNDGGGVYVSSVTKPADVVIRSGKLTGNKAGTSGSTSSEGNGGAIAVISNSSSANADHVIIGLRHKHDNLDTSTRTFKKFPYNDDKDDDKPHEHESCPEITGNESYGNGGGIYMNSSQSKIDIYCLLEENNTAAKDKNGGSIMSEGGNVNIGDIGDGKGNNTADAVGNVLIKSPMLVKGGNVNLYGNTENPKFVDKILVDIIKQGAGSFNDNRFTQITGDKNYKVKYFENFKGTGVFTSMQYDATAEIKAMGNMYEHEGYKIVGWDTKADGKGTRYKINSLISENNHEAWNGKSDTDALELFAIWNKIGYTVIYDANVNDYSGEMPKDTFEYDEEKALSPNAYTVKGKHFAEWNRKADGTGDKYPEDYNESKISKTDGDKVTLYAQWEDCTHLNGSSPGKVTYKANQNTITEICDCGGHTDSVTINAASVYYDGSAHPATLKFTNDWQAAKDIKIQYLYKKTENSEYGELSTGDTEPTEVGYYKASITVNGETAVIEYQIKSPADAAQIDAEVKAGQHFEDFNAAKTCSIAKDDAFTVQYTVQNLNQATNDNSTAAYKTAPVLTLSEQLPAGTTIIMQVEKSYWYIDNVTGTAIDLTSFKKMGTTNETFNYTVKDSQKYRFIIDFSNADKETNSDLTVGLKYQYTNPATNKFESSKDKEETAQVSVNKEYVFTATSPLSGKVSITAPTDIIDTKWQRKNLVWKISTTNKDDKLPSDAELTMSTTVDNKVRTAKYSLNTNGEFIIPFEWVNSKDFTFALDSEQEAASNKRYELTAQLCIGSQKDGTSAQPEALEDNKEKAAANVNLTIPVNTVPSLKISGEERVVTKDQKLAVNIDYENIDNYYIRAIIQKKKSNDEYSGIYTDETITAKGTHSFDLQSTDGPGSYRVWITVSTDSTQKETLLEVPYYFIVQ